MALKYSPGLLSQLANFGQDLTSEQARSGRGISRGPGGMAGAIRDATRAVGSGLFGLDMRSQPEILRAELSTIDPADPQRMAKMYGVLVQYGDPQQKIDAMGKLQELATRKKEAQQQERYRKSLIRTATSIGMGNAVIGQITNATPDELRDLGKEIAKRQIELASRGDDDKASLAYLSQFNITKEDAIAQYGEDIPPIDELEKILTVGDRGSIKAFTNDSGEVKIYSTLGGKVLVDGSWKNASAAGLGPAPQKVQTEELDGIFGKMPKSAKELVNTSISNTIKDGQDADEILRTNAESQRLLDSGEMFTGIAADALVTAEQIGALFGFDATSASVTQQFTLQRFSRVADIIQAYGAGTGLSDADRDFALQQAGKATFEMETLQRLLEIERKYATQAANNRNELIDYLTEKEYMTPEAAGVFQFTRKTPVAAPAGKQEPLSADALRYLNR